MVREARERGRRSLFALLALLPAAACAPDGGGSWAEYRSERFGYTIEYPGDWTVIEARPWEREMTSQSEFLEAGELGKVTFLEPQGDVWPGQFELRVLPNPDGQSLEEWLDGFRLANLSFANMVDTTLAGLPAKRWTRFAYDLIHGEYVAVAGDRAYYVSYDASRDENPDFEVHQDIYGRMVESFSLTGP